MDSKNRRKKAEKLVAELNRLYPELKAHTNLESWRYELKRVTNGVVAVWILFLEMILIIALAVFSDETEPVAVKVFKAVISLVLCGIILFALISLRLTHLDKNNIDVKLQTSWSKFSLKYLQEKLDLANEVLSEYDEQVQAVMPLVLQVERLGVIIEEEDIGWLRSIYEKQPFSIEGVIYDEAVKYDLTSEGYERVLRRVVRAYYGGGDKNIQAFKEAFNLEGKSWA